MEQTKIIIYSDGGSRGNPGPAACGVVIYDQAKNILSQENKFLGVTTNNQAEYAGVLLGLSLAEKIGAQEINFYLDSLLVVNQLKGLYKVKEPTLQPVFLKVWQQVQKFKKVSWAHVPRERNKEADALVNRCLDNNKK